MTMILETRIALTTTGGSLTLTTDALASDALMTDNSAGVTLTINNGTPISLTLPDGPLTGPFVLVNFDVATRDTIFDDIGTTYRNEAIFVLTANAGAFTRNGVPSTEQTVNINAGDRSTADGSYSNTQAITGYPPIPSGVFLRGTGSPQAVVVMDNPADFDSVNPAIGNQGSIGATIVNNARTPAVTTNDPIPLSLVIRQPNDVVFGQRDDYTETLPNYVGGAGNDVAFSPPSAQVSLLPVQRSIAFERTAPTRADTDVSITVFGSQFAAFFSIAGRGYSGNLTLANDRVFVRDFPPLFDTNFRYTSVVEEGTPVVATLDDLDGIDGDVTFTWTTINPFDSTDTTTVRTQAVTAVPGMSVEDRYTPVNADVGRTLRTDISYTDKRSGVAETAFIESEALILSVAATGTLTIAGSTTSIGSTLTASVANLADENGLPTGTDYTVIWMREGVVVATRPNLPVSLAGSDFVTTEAGAYTATLQFTDRRNNRESLNSANFVTLTVESPEIAARLGGSNYSVAGAVGNQLQFGFEQAPNTRTPTAPSNVADLINAGRTAANIVGTSMARSFASDWNAALARAVSESTTLSSVRFHHGTRNSVLLSLAGTPAAIDTPSQPTVTLSGVTTITGLPNEPAQLRASFTTQSIAAGQVLFTIVADGQTFNGTGTVTTAGTDSEGAARAFLEAFNSADDGIATLRQRGATAMLNRINPGAQGRVDVTILLPGFVDVTTGRSSYRAPAVDGLAGTNGAFETINDITAWEMIGANGLVLTIGAHAWATNLIRKGGVKAYGGRMRMPTAGSDQFRAVSTTPLSSSTKPER